MAWDEHWEKVFRENEWGKYPAESLIRFVARNFYLRDRSNTRILEVGCGPGANIWYLAREGFDAYGIDGSETAIETANKRFTKENLTGTLQVGDVINIPFKKEFFDGIIDCECLCCNSLKDTKQILQEIQRVLKPQGLFYSRTVSAGMSLGSEFCRIGKNEYTDIAEGPCGNRGFIRLIDRTGIDELYGVFFDILSVDILDYTNDNGLWLIKEWIIVCQKT